MRVHIGVLCVEPHCDGRVWLNHRRLLNEVWAVWQLSLGKHELMLEIRIIVRMKTLPIILEDCGFALWVTTSSAMVHPLHSNRKDYMCHSHVSAGISLS